MSFLTSVEYCTRTVYLPFFFWVERYRDVKIGFLIVHPSFVWMRVKVMLEIEQGNHSLKIYSMLPENNNIYFTFVISLILHYMSKNFLFLVIIVYTI